jgi:hypothetical protein
MARIETKRRGISVTASVLITMNQWAAHELAPLGGRPRRPEPRALAASGPGPRAPARHRTTEARPTTPPAAYWVAVHAVPQARRPNAPTETTHRRQPLRRHGKARHTRGVS